MNNDYSRLFGASSDAIFVVDPETLHILYQNPIAVELVGNSWKNIPDDDSCSVRNMLTAHTGSCHLMVSRPTESDIDIDFFFGGWPTADDTVYVRASGSPMPNYRQEVDCGGTRVPSSGTSLQKRMEKELQILNYEDLLRRVGHKKEIAEEVIANIRESLPGHIEQCRISFENNNLVELRQTTHTVKGSAGTAGAEIVAERAGQISKLLRRDISDRQLIGDHLNELETAAERFMRLVTT